MVYHVPTLGDDVGSHDGCKGVDGAGGGADKECGRLEDQVAGFEAAAVETADGGERSSSLDAAHIKSGDFPWITGLRETPAGSVPVVATKLIASDKLGHWKIRWGIGRMNYLIPPGIYAAGNPGSGSPVLVTANFKLTFDRVRTVVDGRDVWILVLDTKGINVWCAAGKGNFGTEEVVRRIEETQLSKVVSHRTLILPQLSASGVAAHLVTKSTGFHVVFGPVRAEDLPAFLDSELKTTPEMRRVRFGFKDRLVLTPVEFTIVLRNRFFLAFLALWIVHLLGVRFISIDGLAVLGALFIGAVVFPLLLPWIPGRPFALKGAILGLIYSACLIAVRGLPPATPSGWAEALSALFLMPAITAFLAMNFTGSSTFTSLSGVVKEMKYAIPSIILSAVIGIAAMVIGIFI